MNFKSRITRHLLSLACLIALAAAPASAKSSNAFSSLQQNPSVTVMTDFTLIDDGKDSKPLVIVSSSTSMAQTFTRAMNSELEQKGYLVSHNVLVGGGYSISLNQAAVVLQTPDEKYYESKSQRDRRGDMAIVFKVDQSKLKTPPYFSANLTEPTTRLKGVLFSLFGKSKVGQKKEIQPALDALNISGDQHVLLVSARVKPGSVTGKVVGAALGGLIGMAISSALKPGIDLQVRLVDVGSGTILWTDSVHSEKNPSDETIASTVKALLKDIPNKGENK